MPVDIHASDPAFGSARRAAKGVDELIAYARTQLGAERPWTLVSSRMKLAKTFFEVDDGERRIIGKVSRSERAKHSYGILRRLWDAGLRPPAKCVVVEPIAWLPERNLLLQAKARGKQLVEMLDDPSRAEPAAAWLGALRQLDVHGEPAPVDDSVIDRCARELDALLPGRVARIAEDLRRADTPAELVPSHGDYHPMNLYVDADGAATAIDLDTFAYREPAADIGYFAAQTAIFGFHAYGSFERTAAFRRRFLDLAPPAGRARVDWHMRLAFFRSLHYDLCILKNGNTAIVEPFLEAASYGLQE